MHSKIGKAAGVIWSYLKKNGTQSLTALMNGTKLEKNLFHWGVGWLAREGKLGPEFMRGGTFTITNIGPLGGTALMPTINYPEVAILAMGKVQEKPVVRNGEIVIRKMLPLTLAFDHRIADGADAARFVAELVRQLSDPNLLLLET